MRILLVEDDALLGDGIKKALTREGYNVEWLLDGAQALSAIRSEEFTVVILDLTLPSLDGLEVLKGIRLAKVSTPVLVLTARDTLEAKISGLDAGADDYLTKPFELEELKARLRALSRRPQEQADTIVEHGSVRINQSTMEVFHEDTAVELSRHEYALLLEFITHPGRVMTREHLENTLYGWDGDVGSNALEVHIHHIRKKLYSTLITTVRGIGYRLQQL